MSTSRGFWLDRWRTMRGDEEEDKQENSSFNQLRGKHSRNTPVCQKRCLAVLYHALTGHGTWRHTLTNFR